MPTLPTITISNDAVWQRVLKAFDGDPAVYRAWLKERLKERVIDRESSEQRGTLRANVDSLIDDLDV